MRQKFSTQKNDEYYTPKYAILPIIEYCKKYKTIWCPCDKEWSNFVILLKEQGCNVIHTHIDDGFDFLKYQPDFEYDAIITNPPFSIKNDIIKRCNELNKPWCLLLPFSIMSAKSTIKTLSECDTQFFLFDDRITYDGSRPNFTSCYIANRFFEKDVNYYIFRESPLKLYKQEQI